MSEVTRLTQRIADGDRDAAGQLLPIVYAELRRLAEARMRHENSDNSLQPTALVHEAYLRLVGDAGESRWKDRGHFFGAAAEAMRRILIDRARKRQALKRGGDIQRVPLDDGNLAAAAESEVVLSVNEALEAFSNVDAVGAELVKLRFFAGLTIPQAAEVLGISPSTADRSWAYSRSWLHDYLRSSPSGY